MLGLAVLFGLGLWLLVTIVAMVIGAKFGRRPATKLLGAFLGFMLTMGGFIVYWTVEYYQIQRTVTHLCETEGGITVYVTPEEWRKQIGEEEWADLVLINNSIPQSEKIEITFEGKTYYPMSKVNRRLNAYWRTKAVFDSTGMSDVIFYDVIGKRVLYREVTYSVGVPAIANSIEGLKFWINEIKDCDGSNFTESERFKAVYEYTNYLINGDKQ